MSAKCEVSKKRDLIEVKFRLTEGEARALRNALERHDTPVGEDVRAFYENALSRSNIKL